MEVGGFEQVLLPSESSNGVSVYRVGGGLVAKWCPAPATPWILSHRAPLSMRLPMQEYWGGFPFPSPGDFPDPGIKPGSPALQADSLTPERLNFYEYLV